MSLVYKVCIPHTKRDSFDYLAKDQNPCIGARVWVSFRKSMRLGIVIAKGLAEKEDLQLKPIEEVIDLESYLSSEILNLCLWISHYYQSPLSEVLPLALPKKFRLGQDCLLPMQDVYQLALPLDKIQEIIPKSARRQQDLIAFLSRQSQPVSKKCLTENGFNSSQILALLKKEVLSLSTQTSLPEPSSKPLSPALALNAEQALACSTICKDLDSYRCYLLQGVTGSGKTEVYLQVIAKILEQGRQVLILVPEIGLTPQLLARFTARFNQSIAVMHSHLNESERQNIWLLAQNNAIDLVIGTRSSVFVPLNRLGLIVIDEEHDASFKQMDGVRYSARDTALMRAHWAGIPIILGSATPSLESLYNYQKNKYSLLRLNHKALSSSLLQYQLVDLRAQNLRHGLCSLTLDTIKEHVQKNNQVLVFINRRGFAPILLCHACGWMADCRACDSHLTFHKELGQMICHHCGASKLPPQSCPSCQNKEFLPLGAGTQRVHECLSQCFPDTQILRIDSDVLSKKNTLNACLEKINSRQAQLIVGTQMLAKGHHFPDLSLVVVVDADAGLYNQDFKAMEHLGQLLIQVAGRAGRADRPGQVLIQTHLPNHPLLNLLIQEGYDQFSQKLLSMRMQAGLPPFYYLALIRAQGHSLPKLLQFLQAAKDFLQPFSLNLMGPAPAPLARKANQHRMQLLIKSSSRKQLGEALSGMREALAKNTLSYTLRWGVDVDPMDLS